MIPVRIMNTEGVGGLRIGTYLVVVIGLQRKKNWRIKLHMVHKFLSVMGKGFIICDYNYFWIGSGVGSYEDEMKVL